MPMDASSSSAAAGSMRHGGDNLLEAYWKCDGIENESDIKNKDKHTRILGFEWGLSSPVDTHTGQASGRRQHKPIYIKKLLDKSTPLIVQAIAQNEKKDKSEIIVCQVFGKDAKKIDKFKISLEGVRFIDLKTVGGEDGAAVVDHIQFVYDKVTYEDIPAKKMAVDDYKDI